VNLVTGGTGFIGTHVVRALLGQGEAVRCLVRTTSNTSNLSGLDVEHVTGDLRDPPSLAGALRGVGRVYHCAADYRLYARYPRELYATNVDGTRNLCRAAYEAGVERFVYTSTVGTLATSRNGTPATEMSPVCESDMVGHYKLSKFRAERIAEAWVRRGLPVIIVNPSTPVGERDLKPTPTGRIIVDYLRGRMKAFVRTGLNIIDVRDVAAGHLLAAERGRIGEKYILGHENLTLRELFERLALLTGIPPPLIKVPHWLPMTVAAIDTVWARLREKTPAFPLESVRLAHHMMFFDAGRAVRELGLPQSPVDEALARAVVWFRTHQPRLSP